MLTVDTWGADQNEVLSGKGVRPLSVWFVSPRRLGRSGPGQSYAIGQPKGGMGTFR